MVAPTSTTVPSSTYGRNPSCCARLKRWISSTNSSVPCPAVRRCRARSKTLRRSATPEKTAPGWSCRSRAVPRGPGTPAGAGSASGPAAPPPTEGAAGRPPPPASWAAACRPAAGAPGSRTGTPALPDRSTDRMRPSRSILIRQRPSADSMARPSWLTVRVCRPLISCSTSPRRKPNRRASDVRGTCSTTTPCQAPGRASSSPRAGERLATTAPPSGWRPSRRAGLRGGVSGAASSGSARFTGPPPRHTSRSVCSPSRSVAKR